MSVTQDAQKAIVTPILTVRDLAHAIRIAGLYSWAPKPDVRLEALLRDHIGDAIATHATSREAVYKEMDDLYVHTERRYKDAKAGKISQDQFDAECNVYFAAMKVRLRSHTTLPA